MVIVLQGFSRRISVTAILDRQRMESETLLKQAEIGWSEILDIDPAILPAGRWCCTLIALSRFNCFAPDSQRPYHVDNGGAC